MAQSDLTIVGAGVVGLWLSQFFAKKGYKVELLEAMTIGNGASSKALGVAWPPAPHRNTDFHKIHRKSLSVLASKLSEIEEESEIKVFKQLPAIEIFNNIHQHRIMYNEISLIENDSSLYPTGVSLKEATPEDYKSYLNNKLHFSNSASITTPICLISPKDLLEALRIVCLKNNVLIKENCPIKSIIEKDTNVIIQSNGQNINANKVIITAGINSHLLGENPSEYFKMIPIFGQVVELSAINHGIKCIIRYKKVYIIPKTKDVLIVGATTEKEAGFLEGSKNDSIEKLISTITEIYDEAKNFPIINAWSGLRPATKDRLPIIDKLPNANNIFIATGHYKIGFGYLPATSELMSYLLDNITHSLGKELYISEGRMLMAVN